MIFLKEGDYIVRNYSLLLILGVGAFFDIRDYRIPNWLVLFGIIIGILIEFSESEIPIWFLLRFILVITVFFVLFVCRMVGAGDIKMAALICAYLGFHKGAMAVGFGFLIGAFWSLMKMIVKGSLIIRLSCLLTYIRCVFHTKKLIAYYESVRDGYDVVIPMGMCLLLGTMAYFLL